MASRASSSKRRSAVLAGFAVALIVLVGLGAVQRNDTGQSTTGSNSRPDAARDQTAAPYEAAAFRTSAPKLSLGHGFVMFPGGADQWIAAHPKDPRTSALRAKLGGKPSSLWLTGNESFGNLRSYVARARARNGTMVLTTWNLPLRWDGLSGLSKVTTKQYTHWITTVAKTIGRTRAVLVLEPDALWFYDRLPDARARAQRITALAAAERALKRYATRTRVYIEAGTASGSVTPARMATLLRRAGLSSASGYAVNVSSYAPTKSITSYAQQIRAELKRRGVVNPRYVIDTGRNGARSWNNTWCNPTSQRLGRAPARVAASSGLDFRLWVKEPGTSDGDCGPAGAGQGSYGGQFLPTVAYRMIS